MGIYVVSSTIFIDVLVYIQYAVVCSVMKTWCTVVFATYVHAYLGTFVHCRAIHCLFVVQQQCALNMNRTDPIQMWSRL